ncbi:hypothetical protein A9995_07605 [Erythrobacter sp. QSSC1-22B]|uniref:DUF6173 family protein n=1 Tax=Erythrobacter sp. QSSC1-22B TaxID=1860125 RepID=UPI000804F3DF|nr:DUF6173 family protein [Erythrobacter sp. QSSC1-22B]OBX19597.1 hypothetical protein A9995_07605 [Erythrobacter sp. QSSC1-22B]
MNDTFARITAPEVQIPKLHIPKAPANWAYERIARQINDFEADLSEGEEIGLRLVATPDTSVMHIVDVGYWGPDMLIYYGENERGKPMQLLQHYTQMSILLTAVPKVEEKPRRIGFHLIEKIEPSEDD